MNYGFGEASLEYFESWNFSCENTNIGVPMFMFDIRMIEVEHMYVLSGCELIDAENISLPSQNVKFVGE
jgi:hypothetical protein